jgi:hypothetical protein
MTKRRGQPARLLLSMQGSGAGRIAPHLRIRVNATVFKRRRGCRSGAIPR